MGLSRVGSITGHCTPGNACAGQHGGGWATHSTPPGSSRTLGIAHPAAYNQESLTGTADGVARPCRSYVLPKGLYGPAGQVEPRRGHSGPALPRAANSWKPTCSTELLHSDCMVTPGAAWPRHPQLCTRSTCCCPQAPSLPGGSHGRAPPVLAFSLGRMPDGQGHLHRSLWSLDTGPHRHRGAWSLNTGPGTHPCKSMLGIFATLARGQVPSQKIPEGGAASPETTMKPPC